MTIKVSPTIKDYGAQLARVKAIRDRIASSDILISDALGGIATGMLDKLLSRATFALIGSVEYLACYEEMKAIPNLP